MVRALAAPGLVVRVPAVLARVVLAPVVLARVVLARVVLVRVVLAAPVPEVVVQAVQVVPVVRVPAVPVRVLEAPMRCWCARVLVVAVLAVARYRGGPTGKIIYVTSMPLTANFGGISGADAQCNTSPPTVGSYKALLVDGTTRVACTSAQCATSGAAEGVDWVLAPNTKYVRADGTTVIGTTSAAAIFAFPLTASIGTNGYSYWTGLNADWTTSSDSCSGWTQTTSGFSASEGLANTSDSQAISGVSDSCATLAGAFFACVEQ